MGGTQIDDITAPNEIIKLADQVICYVKEVLQSNVVRIKNDIIFANEISLTNKTFNRCHWDALLTVSADIELFSTNIFATFVIYLVD